jgi:iron complex transport system ATP-binding protein
MKLAAGDIHVRSGRIQILDGVSVHVESGELAALIGPNGAGKSTLLRAMVGVMPTGAGCVLLDDQPLRRLPARHRARHVAYLPQERHIEWRLKGRDVVMLGRYPYRRPFLQPSRQDHQAVDRALALMQAQGLAERSVANLSSGERARIWLARALAVEAPLLVADEPITDLDPYHQLLVMETLRELAENSGGVLVVLHDLALAARFATRLILLHRGRVVATGSPVEVLSDEHLARVYRVAAQDRIPEGIRMPWSRLG